MDNIWIMMEWSGEREGAPDDVLLFHSEELLKKSITDFAKEAELEVNEYGFNRIDLHRAGEATVQFTYSWTRRDIVLGTAVSLMEWSGDGRRAYEHPIRPGDLMA